MSGITSGDVIFDAPESFKQSKVSSADGNIVSNGGTHGIYCALHAELEPGGGVIGPDPTMPGWAGRERCGPASASGSARPRI